MSRKSYRKAYICKVCGQNVHGVNKEHVCADCVYKYGDVWVLNPESGKWSKEDRGELPKLVGDVHA